MGKSELFGEDGDTTGAFLDEAFVASEDSNVRGAATGNERPAGETEINRVLQVETRERLSELRWLCFRNPGGLTREQAVDLVADTLDLPRGEDSVQTVLRQDVSQAVGLEYVVYERGRYFAGPQSLPRFDSERRNAILQEILTKEWENVDELLRKADASHQQRTKGLYRKQARRRWLASLNSLLYGARIERDGPLVRLTSWL